MFIDKLESGLNDPFHDEPVHHRWLLTTCVAGIVGTIVIGGVALGLFGENAAPRDAYAAIDKSAQTDGTGSKIAVTASLAPQTVEVIPERDLSGDNNYPEITADELPYGDGKTVVLDAEIQASEAETTNITTISKTAPAEPTDETFKIAKGSTLIDALIDRGVTKEVAQALSASIEPIFPARMIKNDMEFSLTLDRQQDFYGRDATFPVELSFKPGPKEIITVQADDEGRFVASVDGKKEGAKSQYAQITQFKTKAKVGASLYGTAKDNKVPDYIISELTRAFSYDVDFQRQVKPTDTFEVFYGNPLTGSSTKRKVLHYAQLTLDGVTKTYYRYANADGQVEFVDGNGRGASKSLLKTPVSGSKITSGFGMRKHPLLGYSKMHAGIDFGVPYGSPIRSAGSGVVEIAGRHGAYGVTVQIKHSNKFETLYAHMSKLAAGIRTGTKVNQGQIIGYVGSTGRSTGPHLHYEVRAGGRAINPQQVKASGAKQLAGKELQKFKLYKQRVLAMMQTAPSALQVAQVDQ
ncbi:MAG: peptidoglycan DD-metalloendopeptidase family protein [Burkholderiaceae bacterium]